MMPACLPAALLPFSYAFQPLPLLELPHSESELVPATSKPPCLLPDADLLLLLMATGVAGIAIAEEVL